ncbi:MAG: tryptophan 7-halogenase [Pseudomonadota bacterium]
MQSPDQINKIVIVGGGTAGWLAANHLAKNLASINENGVEILLIESPNIPTIGVGEGTVPLMRQTLMELGIRETEFITQCDATFKQGIKFVNWLNNPIKGKPSYYHHSFDFPNINDINLTSYWLQNNNSQSYADAVSIQSKISDAGLAPKMISTPEYEGLTSYAYHLDAGKFAQILMRNAVEKLGVKHLRCEVKSANVADNGEIKSLNTDTLGEISADFFVDCTGFKSLLIGDVLKVKFIDKSEFLFVDHAVTMQIPYEQEDSAIASHTISTALSNGWIWDIGLKQRRGIGHVYSSKYTSHEQAEIQLRNYIGSAASGINSRLISMNIGYREKFWHKNCVALGLAQGFVEPLEATGLLIFDATAKMLAKQFPVTKTEMPLVAKQFNENVTKSWDNVIDFVKLHYCLSRRDDSEFWIDNRDAMSIPDSLKEQLERWQYQPPTQYDFSSRFDIFNLENYLYVLYGMEYKTKIELSANRLQYPKMAQKQFKEIAAQTDIALQRLPTNRELIEKIYLYGLRRN